VFSLAGGDAVGDARPKVFDAQKKEAAPFVWKARLFVFLRVPSARTVVSG